MNRLRGSHQRLYGLVPQGMLAPSGYAQTAVDPMVQATTRPAGSILAPSPGYDSVRAGKNVFQGKGPTGGFQPLEFAEDVGGTGAALAVVPGDVASLPDSVYLPEYNEQLEPGSVIVSDRPQVGDALGPHAHSLHEGMRTLPDLGDRSPGRPLSRAILRLNPANVLREDYRENRVLTVLMCVGLIGVVKLLGDDLEREYHSRKGVTRAPAAVAATGGDEVNRATGAISDAGDRAVGAIKSAADDAVGAIRDAGQAARDSVQHVTA